MMTNATTSPEILSPMPRLPAIGINARAGVFPPFWHHPRSRAPARPPPVRIVVVAVVVVVPCVCGGPGQGQCWAMVRGPWVVGGWWLLVDTPGLLHRHHPTSYSYSSERVNTALSPNTLSLLDANCHQIHHPSLTARRLLALGFYTLHTLLSCVIIHNSYCISVFRELN